jgi:hypothetical protein
MGAFSRMNGQNGTRSADACAQGSQRSPTLLHEIYSSFELTGHSQGWPGVIGSPGLLTASYSERRSLHAAGHALA